MYKQLLLSLFIVGRSIYAQDTTLPEEVKNKVVGVRIDDLGEVYPTSIPGLANFLVILNKNPEHFFVQGKIDVVHDVLFVNLPEISQSQIKLNLLGVVKYKNGQMNLEKFSVVYAPKAINTDQFIVVPEKIINSKELSFEAKVGLIQRKLILEDKSKNIKFVFAIGVGAFDEGVMNENTVSLLTPRFQNGIIDQRAVDSKREKPKYFKGMPFIRLLKGTDIDNDVTSIGFHIEINDSFVRGFDSHGCMRLRQKDLLAFHDLIMLGSQQQIPLKVRYQIDDSADNPILKRNKVYKTIQNNGSVQSPFFPLDRDNLVQLRLTESQAPVEKLEDFDNDDYENIYSYNTITQMREQDQRRYNECQARVMKGEVKTDSKSFQKCLDEGKRKDSLADRIYRKWMGIDDIPSNSQDSLI